MTGRFSGLSERLAAAGFAAGWRLVRGLPEPVATAVFDDAARLAARRGGAGSAQLRRNLARVRPQASAAELDRLLLAGLRSYARYWREVFRLPALDPAALWRTVDGGVTGAENLDKALAEGNGAVLALCHSGNWDVAGVWLAQRQGGFTTVAERLRPESLYRRFADYRESLGFEIVPLTGGREPASRVLARRLRENRPICLLAERDLTATGIAVDFFGAPAHLPSGPAGLAALTGAHLLPAQLWFPDGPRGRSWRIHIHPALPVERGRTGIAAATQRLADTFAGFIAEHPEDWHMLQVVWRADLARRDRTPDGHTGGTMADPLEPRPPGGEPDGGSGRTVGGAG